MEGSLRCSRMLFGDGLPGVGSSAEFETARDGGAGTTAGRSRALGGEDAEVPDEFDPGGGTRAAMRRRKASGDSIRVEIVETIERGRPSWWPRRSVRSRPPPRQLSPCPHT